MRQSRLRTWVRWQQSPRELHPLGLVERLRELNEVEANPRV